MKKPNLLGLIIIAIVVSTLFGGVQLNCARAMVFSEVQITSNPAAQENPDIYVYNYSDYIVVWQDNRNGNWDIYMYAQGLNSMHPEIRVTANSSNNINPRIYRDTIVYQSDRNGNLNIYMYNITSKVETRITNSTGVHEFPAIDGNIIVWQDSRNGVWDPYGFPPDYTEWDIYMYNLTSKTEQRIPLSYSNYSPSISGNRLAYVKYVTWQDWQGTKYIDVYSYCYDFSTGKETQLVKISDHPYAIAVPLTAIEGSRVAWSSVYTPSLWNIQMEDVLTGGYWKFGVNAQHFDISGEGPYTYIVYDDYRNGNSQIYMYDVGLGVEDRVTNNNATQLNPRISAVDNSIVYSDNRNGNWDIYLTMFGYGVGATAPSNQSTLSPSPRNSVNSGNQGLITIMVIAAAIVVVVVVGTAAFMAKQRKSTKPNK